MTPNGKLTSVSDKWDEYVEEDDTFFLYVLSFVLRDEQEEDNWFNTNKSLISSCDSFSVSSALDDRWFDGVLDAVLRSLCGHSEYSFLIFCLAMFDIVSSLWTWNIISYTILQQ